MKSGIVKMPYSHITYDICSKSEIWEKNEEGKNETGQRKIIREY